MRFIHFKWLILTIIISMLSACASTSKHIFNPEVLPPNQKWIMVDNVPIVYTDEGHGDTILILSTYPLRTESWNGLTSLLSKDFRVIIAEPPWLMEPGAMKGDFSSEHILQLYRSFIRKLGITEVNVLGVGEGGGLAVAFGHHFPEHIITAISINGFEGVTWSDESKAMLDLIYSTEEAGIMKMINTSSLRYRQEMPSGEDMKQSLRMPEKKEQVKAVHDRQDYFKQDITSLYITAMIEYIHFPVMIIRSEKDSILPEKYTEWSHNRIRGVRYEFIPNAGHFAFLDQPEKTAELIREFIQKDHPHPVHTLSSISGIR
ncbi:MAG: hypothetical protein A2Z60_01675 [Nitrospirae bacterium RIFCSPLOWO2_02_42_7]|nr:MAG: hypothetical protein A2Z60_01675 [Nitrospirae bacterium RIFCSPLOWO2_02_42_7]